MKYFLQRFMLCLILSILTFVTTATAQSKMYWSEHVSDAKIRCADLDGSNIEDIFTVNTPGFSAAFDLVTDDVGGKLLWIDHVSGKIQRADLDGNNLEDILTGLTGPNDIALDATGGKIYWTDYDFSIFSGNIRRANLDGSSVEDLVDLGTSTPTGLALDISGGKMYWTTSQPGRIQRANLDGSDSELLLEIQTSRSIALDVPGGKMYWTDDGLSDPAIQRADLDGSNSEILVSNGPTPVLERPWGITLDLQQGKMYWTDFNAEKIQRADLDGSNLEDVIASGIASPQYMDISQPGPNAIDDVVKTIPSVHALEQNFPNPFNPTTTISFDILGTSGTKQNVSLIIYDSRGHHVKTLVDRTREPGHYQIQWDGKNTTDEAVGSGIYFYKLTAGDKTVTRKMMITK